MYGTVARIKLKPGSFDNFRKTMDEQAQSYSGSGAVAVLIFRSDGDPDELYMVAASESEETYRASAEDPVTDANYRLMAQFFAEEPQWTDGEVVYHEIFK